MNVFGERIEKGDVPAHIQVRDRILDEIRSGTLAPGEKLPSEPELARLLGVSRMTANKSILSLVSEGWLTREKGRGTFVADAPSAVPATCALVLPVDTDQGLEDPYFGSLYWALQRSLATDQIRLELIRLHGPIPAPAAAYVAVDPPESAVPSLAALGGPTAPTILLGSSWNHPSVTTVDSDNLMGGALATNHLLDLGHRDILFLGACPHDSNTIDRVRGFRVAMRCRGLEPAAPLILPEAWGIDPEGERELAAILTSPRRPTAVFAAGAKLAFHLLGLLQRLELRCPQEVSVVAYDDPDFLSLSYPPLTTVRQPLGQMAEAAARLVREAVRGRANLPTREVFEPELIVRGSTGLPSIPTEDPR